MAFQAGSIVATLDVDKSPFDRGLDAAKKDADAFTARKYEAKLGVDTSAGKRDLKSFNDSLTAFRQRKALATVGLADAGFRKTLEARNRDLDQFRHRKVSATADVNTAAAQAKLTGLGTQLDALGRRKVTVPVNEATNRNITTTSRNTSKLIGEVNGLGAAIAAVTPLAATAAGTLASMGAGAALAFGSAAVGAGTFFAAFKSNLKPLQDTNKQLTQYQKVLKSSTATAAQKATAQAKINDLLKGESTATRQARESLTGYSTAWTKFRTSLQPQSFSLLATGLTIFQRGLTAVQPAAASAGTAIDKLAKQAAGVLDPSNTSRSAVAWQRLFHTIDTESGPVITRVGKGLGGIATGFAAMAPAFKPVVDMLTTGFQRIGDAVSRWATSARGQATFQKWSDYFVRNGPVLATDLGKIAQAVGHLITSLAPIGEKALSGLQTLFANHPGLAQTAVNMVAIGAAFKVFGGKITLLTTPLKFLVGLLGFGGEGAEAGLAGLLGASGPVGLAIGAAVVAIGALTAGMIALYKNSATFRGYVSQIVDGLRTAARVFMQMVSPAFAQIGKAISDNSGQWHWLLVQLKPVIDFVQRYALPVLGIALAASLSGLAIQISLVIRAIGGLVALFRLGFKQTLTDLSSFGRALQTIFSWGAKAFSWVPGVGTTLGTLARWVGNVAGVLGRMRNGFTDNTKASRAVGSAAGTMAGQLLKLVNPTNSATGATNKLTASMKQANQHATTLLSSLRKLAGGDLAVLQAQDDYTAAVKRADRALVQSRGNVDGRTAADRRARKALDQEVVSGVDYIRYLKQSGASNDTVRKAIIKQRDQVQKQAGDTKYGKKIIGTYNKELSTIPKTKKTNITVHGTGSFTIPKSVSGAMNTAFNILKGIKYAGGGVAKRAHGALAGGGVARYALAGGGGTVDPAGVVHGPGGDRTDTAGLYALSRDEFVVNAPASRAFRPQLVAMNEWGNRGTGYRGQYAGGGLASPPPAGTARVPQLVARLPIKGGLLAGGIAGGHAGDKTAAGDYKTWSGNIPSLMDTVATGVNKVTTAVFAATAATMGKQWAKIVSAYNSGAGIAGQALRNAETQLGVPYVWGGTAWGRGMDCSGLVMESYLRAGKKIPRTSQQQYNYTRRIKMSETVPGDLIFWEGVPPGHVGMIVNHNKAINEPHTGAVTRYRSTAGYVALGRVPGAAGGVPQGMGSTAKKLAYNILKQEGQARYYGALVNLWNRESNWNPNAVNRSSGAYGIPQALGHGHPYALGDWAAQVRWGLNYIARRYGNPGAAWAHEKRYGWYDTGGDLTPGATLAINALKGGTIKQRTESVITDEWRTKVEDRLNEITTKLGDRTGPLVDTYNQNFYGSGDTREAMQALLFTLRRARQEAL